MTLKLCKDCSHFREYIGGPMPALHSVACAAPQRPGEPDPAYGHIRVVDARTMRQYPNHCGPKADWFEPRQAHRPTWWKRLLFGDKPYTPPLEANARQETP
jgi:hypothetical protein